jgi:hypothetical protein
MLPGTFFDKTIGNDACVSPRKGLEGFSHASGGAGAIAEPRKARSPPCSGGDAPILFFSISSL